MNEKHSITWLEKAISDGNINFYGYGEFSDNEKISDGGFSFVTKSEWKNGGLTVALKCLKVSTVNTEEYTKAFVKELQVLQRVSFHPKINHFYGVTQDPNDGSYKMVLQFANNGNLREYLTKNFLKLQWENKFRIAEEIAQGLLFLHNNSILHRDLHPKNILVHDNKMMIADFGLAKEITTNVLDSNSNVDGMPAFIDPQCFKVSTYKRSAKSDIYSYGVILWEISSGHKPFPLLKRMQIAIQIYNGMREKPVKGTPPEYVKLYSQCWDDDPKKRPEIQDVFDSLNQLIYKPDPQMDMKKPLKRLLEKAFAVQTINYYESDMFSDRLMLEDGAFGPIFKSEWKDANLIVTLKCLKITDNQYLDESIAKDIVEKICNLQNADFHPNIIKFYGLTKDPSSEYYNTVFQFADGGTLRDYLAENFYELQWDKKISIAIEIAEGLKHLHENGITHRNLHSKNILIHEGKMLIGGFDLYEQLNESSLAISIHRGMPAYIEPQCLMNPTYQRDKKSDIYSFGVILWVISSGQQPFKNFGIGYAIAIHVFNGGRETPVQNTPPRYEQLYKQCWDEDPKKRSDISSVLNQLTTLRLEF